MGRLEPSHFQRWDGSNRPEPSHFLAISYNFFAGIYVCKSAQSAECVINSTSVWLVHSDVEVDRKQQARLFVASTGDEKSTAIFCRLRRHCGRDLRPHQPATTSTFTHDAVFYLYFLYSNVWLLLTGDRCLTTEHKTSTGVLRVFEHCLGLAHGGILLIIM